jgi:hypothetical protein
MSSSGGSKIIGTVFVIGAIAVFDVLSYVFHWGWILY